MTALLLAAELDPAAAATTSEPAPLAGPPAAPALEAEKPGGTVAPAAPTLPAIAKAPPAPTAPALAAVPKVDPIAATSIAAGPSAAAVDPAPAASTAAATPEPLAAPAGPPLADSPPVLLLRRELSSGAALERLIEPSGDIVVHLVTPAGTVDSCEKVGTLFALPLLEQTFVAGGEVVHVARDESGAIVRYVVRADGEPRAVAVVAPSRFR